MRITLQIPDSRPLIPHGQLHFSAADGIFSKPMLWRAHSHVKPKRKHLRDKNVQVEEIRMTQINARMLQY